MTLRDIPIRRKVTLVILLTSVTVMLVMRTTFFIFEYVTFRQATTRHVSTLAKVIAANSTGALAFDNREDAQEVLSSLRAERPIVAACLYGKMGELYAQYPTNRPASAFPAAPGKEGFRFSYPHLSGYQLVVQGGNKRLGTLYLEYDVATTMHEWLRHSLLVAVPVILFAMLVALALSPLLQKQISQPILKLAETARAVSDRRDYSVRATKHGEDELGLLTDAFNQMLTSIESGEATLRKLSRVVEQGADSVSITDPDGVIEYVNPAFEALTGYPAPEVLGQKMSLLKSGRHDAAFYKRLWDTILAGETFHGVLINKKKNGELYHEEKNITPLKDLQGRIIHFVSTGHDITGRIRVEEELRRLNETLEQRVQERTAELGRANEGLRELEERRRQIIETARDAFVGMDAEGKIIDWNRQAEVIFGWPREEAIGRSLAETIVPPQHREAHKQGLRRFLATGEGPVLNKRLELTALRKDGREFPVEMTIWPARIGSQAYRFNAFLHDITERKHAEALLEHERYLLRSLMDNVPDRIWFKDREGRFQRNNLAHLKRFGLTDPAQAIGKTDFDFFPEAHARRAYEEEQQVLRTGEPLNKEEKISWPDGNVTWALITRMPLRDEAERIVGTFGISRDITEVKQAGEALRKLADDLAHSNQALEALNKELEAFSYSVSHDLRAPLRHISGFVELLNQTCLPSLDDSGKRYLGIISDAATQMGTLIDDLLLFSRLGRSEMRRSTVITDELVGEVVREMAQDLAGRNIAWEIGPLPVVHGDRAMLKQVWVNLLSNAVKYTGHRERAVIKVASRKNDQGEWEFSVSDNGAGFDMQYAGKLFGVFQRLHQAEEFEGTGIGLANVQRIVLRHGGRVWAEGKVDAGATFYYSLPDLKKEKT